MHPAPRSMHAMGLNEPLIACNHIPTGDVARQAALMWPAACSQAAWCVGGYALSGQIACIITARTAAQACFEQPLSSNLSILALCAA